MALPPTETSAATVYPLPTEMPKSQRCQVTVDGMGLDVLDVQVNHRRVWSATPTPEHTPLACFDIAGQVTVTARFPGETLDRVTLHPLALGLVPRVSGDTVTFTLDAPTPVTVEYSGQTQGAFHLFARTSQAASTTPMPTPDDPDVLLLEPGVHHRNIRVHSGQTVMFAPGAVLRGSIRGENVHDVRICGRALLDGSDLVSDGHGSAIQFDRSQRIFVEDVTLINPPTCALRMVHCDRISLTDLCIVNAVGDGVSIVSCTQVSARRCFVRAWGDALSVKAEGGTADTVLFEDCVLWNDLGHPCEIGYQTNAPAIRNITFRDITVLHCFHKPVLSIHNSDSALVSQVLYHNILVEDAQMGQGDGVSFLVDLSTARSLWSQTAQRGNIRDVTIDGLTVLGGKAPPLRLWAYDLASTINLVHLKRILLLDKPVLSWADLPIQCNEKVGRSILLYNPRDAAQEPLPIP